MEFNIDALKSEYKYVFITEYPDYDLQIAYRPLKRKELDYVNFELVLDKTEEELSKLPAHELNKMVLGMQEQRSLYIVSNTFLASNQFTKEEIIDQDALPGSILFKLAEDIYQASQPTGETKKV